MPIAVLTLSSSRYTIWLGLCKAWYRRKHGGFKLFEAYSTIGKGLSYKPFLFSFLCRSSMLKCLQARLLQKQNKILQAKAIFKVSFSERYISPYIIFVGYLRRMPDMQSETGRPIYFWNRLLKVVVLQKQILISCTICPERSKTL